VTRKLWLAQQAKHRRNIRDDLATLVDLRKRVDRLKTEHPEWFKQVPLEQNQPELTDDES
jgi:hypothetical protein